MSEMDSGLALVTDGGVGGASTRRVGDSTFAGEGFSIFAAGAAVRTVFSFGSEGSARTAALTGLRAGAVLRTAVLVVVFEGILFF